MRRDRDGPMWRQEDERRVKAILLSDKGSSITRRGKHGCACAFLWEDLEEFPAPAKLCGGGFAGVRPQEPGLIQLPGEPPSSAIAQPTLGPFARLYTVLLAKTSMQHGRSRMILLLGPGSPPKPCRAPRDHPSVKPAQVPSCFIPSGSAKGLEGSSASESRRLGPALPSAAAISSSFFAIPLGRPRRVGRDLAALQGEANANISSVQGGCGPGIKFPRAFPAKASERVSRCEPRNTALCPVQKKNPRALLFFNSFSVKGQADRHGHSIFKSAANALLQVLFAG